MSENKDINQKIDELGAKLDTVTTNILGSDPSPLYLNSSFSSLNFQPQESSRNEELDLREFFNILWQGKWYVICITILFTLLGVFYALNLPNMYKSVGIYAPAKKDGAVGGMAGQLGGLASIAGVSLGGGESNDIDQAIALIVSWPFLDKVISDNELKPLIMGVKNWNRQTGDLIWDEHIYNPLIDEWLGEPTLNGNVEPNSYEVYLKFREMISLDFNIKTSMLTLSVEYFSPDLAKEWLRIIIKAINEEFRSRDILQATKSIEYLEAEISKTRITEMQIMFYDMIETQMTTLMLAEVDEEYLLKTVVPPKVPELKSSPSRTLILLLFCLVGGASSLSYVLVSAFILSERKGK